MNRAGLGILQTVGSRANARTAVSGKAMTENRLILNQNANAIARALAQLPLPVPCDRDQVMAILVIDDIREGGVAAASASAIEIDRRAIVVGVTGRIDVGVDIKESLRGNTSKTN